MSWLLHLLVDTDDVELVSSRLWSLGTSGIAELGDNKVVAGFETEEQATIAASDLGQGRVVLFDPASIPACEPAEVSFGSATIALPDTNAFGHGAHATTALALDAIQRLTQAGMRVLDMGCGTGVLAIAARTKGADVVAVDNDPAAITASLGNARSNGVQFDVLTSLDTVAAPFDLVVANMLLADLRVVAGQLIAAVSNGGIIATTGFLEHQADDVAQLFKPKTVRGKSTNGDWVLLELA